MDTKRKIRNSLFLLMTTAIWGVAFVAQSKGGEVTGPYTFNCIRFLIGGIVLLPVICLLDKMGWSRKKPITKKEKTILLTAGSSCGAALFVASTLQQLAIYYGASIGKAGFLTACYIVIVPVIALFYKENCGWNVWVGVGITLAGLYLLCMKNGFEVERTDILLLLSALCFAVQILLIDQFSPKTDGVRMAAVEFITCGVIGIFPMALLEMNQGGTGLAEWLVPLGTWEAWGPLLYAGVLSCGVAYTLQVVGQNGLNPTIASLIMSLEAVVSALAGWLFLNQNMSEKEVLGCMMMLVAIVLSQIPVKGK